MDAIGYMVSSVWLDQGAVISELLGNALPVAGKCINHDYTNCNSVIDGTISRYSIQKPVASKMRPGEELNELSKKKKEIVLVISYEKKDEKNENDSMSVVIRLILLGFGLVLISSEAGEKPKQRKNSILTLELYIFSLFYPLLILSFLKKKEMRK